MYEFILPDLGEGIHEGEILQWHVNEGEQVGQDAPLVDIETDKAAVTIPSPVAGTLAKQNGNVGDIVQVGDVLCVIDDGSGEKAKPEAIQATIDMAPAEKIESVDSAQPLLRGSRPVPAAPATRRLARELGVDIHKCTPSGPGGRVTPDDVRKLADGRVQPVEKITSPVEDTKLAHAEFAASAIPFLDIQPLPDFEREGPVEKEKLRSIRRKVARKMTTSMILIPHVSHMDEADVTDLEAFRKEQKGKREGKPGSKLTLLAFVVRAVASALRAAPAFNASLDPFREEIIYKKYYNIGIAVDSGKGLIVPVIRNADEKTIIEIADEIVDLATRARNGELKVDELRGGTFTITNIGPIGGHALIPTINYPEVAILAMGKANDVPVVRDGEIVIRKMMPLTFAFDHRIADGADAARFVVELARVLSDPSLLLLET